MKFSRLILTVFCAALCAFVFYSPIFAGDEPVWRPINAADLAAKEPQVEKDADAEAIFWEVRIDDSDSDELAMNHYIRVKIFTERGREKFSKIDVPFVKGMKIKNVMARVIKPDGSIVELKKEEIFEREIIKGDGIKIKAKSFAAPGVEPGVIIEYRYREIIDDAGAIGMRLVFQRDIPIQNISYYYKPHNKEAPNYQNFNMSDTKFVQDKKGYYLATRTNVPAFKEEPRMPPEDKVRPWLLLQGVRLNFSFTEAGISFNIKDPSNPLGYWATVSNEKSVLLKLLKASANDVKSSATEIVGSAATPEEKLKKLYEFCQTEIRNTTFDNSLTDEQRKNLPKIKTIADVLKRKSGSRSEIDLLFGSIAVALGFETRFAFSADRSEMFFEPNMANEFFIHPAAIAVKIENNWKFFKPGTKFLGYGELSWFEEDVWALLVGEKGYAWVKTPMSTPQKSLAKRTGKFRLLEDGTLEGDVRMEYFGHAGITRKLLNDDLSAAKREESLKAEIKEQIAEAELSNITVENVADSAKPFVYAFKVRVPNYAQKTGKRLFLQPNFFEYNSKPIFTASSRKHDVYFRFPWAEQDEIEIELPAGFELENGDAPGYVADPQKIGSDSVEIKLAKDTKKLIYTRKFHFGDGGNILFPVDLYPAVKTLFDAFNKADTHGLILKQSAVGATATGSK